MRRLRTAPLRVRLVGGFVVVMVAVLAAAGGFVYWRVQVALDRTLDDDLGGQVDALHEALARHRGSDPRALATLPAGNELYQVVDARGVVLAASPAAAGLVLLPVARLRAARRSRVQYDDGQLLLDEDRRLRVRAFPVPPSDSRPGLVAVTAVRLSARDEALRELLAQLVVANLAALVLASLVGWRLARAALVPVERYRAQADRIAQGATGVRLDVPPVASDEIGRLGHTLNRMLRAQEQAAQRQRQFLADASHELRTPLTLLTAEVELALRRPRTAGEYEQTLRDVAEDTARLVRLADQLLDLETSAPGGLPVEQARADVWAAAERAAARAAGTDRTVEIRGDHLQVGATVEQLDLLLGNLVDNALVHGRGAVRLEVGGAAGPVCLTVTDEGTGPPADFVPHAVERFRRADAARSRPGNGLGLALVHAVVTGLGGELRMCAAGAHHRYPPHRFDGFRCRHDGCGTTVTVLLAG